MVTDVWHWHGNGIGKGRLHLYNRNILVETASISS
jgi:hypothetical protein